MWIVYLAAILLSCVGIFGLYTALVLTPEQRRDSFEAANSTSDATDIFVVILAFACYALTALVLGTILGYLLASALFLHQLWSEIRNRRIDLKHKTDGYRDNIATRLHYAVVGAADLFYGLLVILSLASR